MKICVIPALSYRLLNNRPPKYMWLLSAFSRGLLCRQFLYFLCILYASEFCKIFCQNAANRLTGILNFKIFPGGRNAPHPPRGLAPSTLGHLVPASGELAPSSGNSWATPGSNCAARKSEVSERSAVRLSNGRFPLLRILNTTTSVLFRRVMEL